MIGIHDTSSKINSKLLRLVAEKLTISIDIGHSKTSFMKKYILEILMIGTT